MSGLVLLTALAHRASGLATVSHRWRALALRAGEGSRPGWAATACLLAVAVAALPARAQAPEEADASAPPIARAQEATTRRYRALEKKLRRLAFVLQRVQPKVSARLQRALSAAKQGSLPELLGRAERLLKSEEWSAAAVTQREALEVLEEVLASLEREDLEGEHQDPRELEKALRRLRRVREAQREHLEDTERSRALDRAAQSLAEALGSVDALLAKQRAVVRKANAGEAPLPAVAREQQAVAEATEALARSLTPARVGTGGEDPSAGGPDREEPVAGGADPSPGGPGREEPTAGAPRAPEGGPLGAGRRGRARGSLEEARRAMEDAAERMAAGQQAPSIERARAAEEALEAAREVLARERQQIVRLAEQERRRAEQERTRTEAEQLARSMGGAPQGAPSSSTGEGSEGGGKASPRPPMPGRRNVERAAEEMRRAGDRMANRHAAPQEVQEAQEQAVRELDQAEQLLEEALQQARKREQDAVLEALGRRFRAMLATQRGLTGRTHALSKKSRLRRKDRHELKKLAIGERTLAGQATDALELVREEGSTVILPVILRELVEDLVRVASLLDERQANAFVVSLQRDIEQTLAELVEVIKRELEERKAGGGGGQGGGGAPNESGDPLLPPTAELKMIRALQARVNALTERFEARGAEETGAQRQAREHLSAKQGRVAAFTRDLHERLAKER
ncbi:MAG: hypothetical protein D6731_14270 [Planctomycetota bacterium]|nr:MAG: hypothetical protein D6731_14270 [Planctomycetota bacterium]